MQLDARPTNQVKMRHCCFCSQSLKSTNPPQSNQRVTHSLTVELGLTIQGFYYGDLIFTEIDFANITQLFTGHDT